MKKILFLFIGLLLSAGGFAQMTANANSTPPMKSSKSDVKMSLDNNSTLMDEFRNEVEDWNVGNLHIHPRSPLQVMSEYKYAGEKSDNKFHELLPWRFQNRVIRGYGIFPVAELRGTDEDKDLFIIRSGKGDATDEIFLFRADNGKFKKAGELAYYKKKGNTWQQLDTWIKDINRDGRLDLVQKKQITDRWGHILGTKTKVLLMNKKGKFKKAKNIPLDDSNYPMENLKKK